MHDNDKLFKYCEFYIGHSVEHRVESNPIFIKNNIVHLDRAKA